jgi:RNA polymerase sigma-70 factor (ECF subfamily)
MDANSIETLFDRFRREADGKALAQVFDRTAPELGRVASYLAGGDLDRAGDLLQQTWLTAITRAGNWDPSRPLLPWLLGVLANHARSGRRAAARAAATRGNPPDGPDALSGLLASDDPVAASADGEFQRLLAAALAQLPSPYREAVTLHVQHGLTAKEIGEALGRPAGTVRTQITRGLDRLRQKLPAGLTGAGVLIAVLGAEHLSQVRAAVLAKLPTPTSLLQHAGWRWAAAVVAVAALAVVPWLGGGSELTPAPPSAGRETASAAAAPSAAPAAERELLDLVAAESPKADPPPRRRITVHVRRTDGSPAVAGEWVGLDDDYGRFVPTDAAGDAVFDDVVPSMAWSVFVCGASGQQAISSPRLPVPDRFDVATTLSISGGAPLVVQVLDAAGKPVADAEVERDNVGIGRRAWTPLGRTDQAGELRLRNQRPGSLRARASGHVLAGSVEAVADGDGVLRARLVLPGAGQSLRGKVVDEHGRGLAAELACVVFASGRSDAWFASTAADGTFVLDWLPAGHTAIVARVPGQHRCGLLRVDLPHRERVEIPVPVGATLTIATRFADGKQAPGMQVDARLLVDGARELPFLYPIQRSDDHGRLQLRGLLPGSWQLEASFGRMRASQRFELADGDEQEWVAVAPQLAQLRVRLLDHEGKVLAPPAPRSWWRIEPFDAAGNPCGSMAAVQADGSLAGAHDWLVPPDAPLTLAIHDPAGYALSRHHPVHEVHGVSADGEVLEVVVPAGRRAAHHLQGRVVDADGQPVSARVFAPSPRYPWLGAEVRTAADGTFRLGPLPPGPLALEVQASGRPVHPLGKVEVPLQGDLDLRDITLAPLVVVRAEPDPRDVLPDDVRLELRAAAGGRYPLVRDGGAFVAANVPHGSYTLLGRGRTHLVAPLTVQVTADAAPCRFRCEPAPTLYVQIELREEDRRQDGWSGVVELRDAADSVVMRRYHSHGFHGRVDNTLPLAFAVAPGNYRIEVVVAGKRRANAAVVVTAAGGAVTLQP